MARTPAWCTSPLTCASQFINAQRTRTTRITPRSQERQPAAKLWGQSAASDVLRHSLWEPEFIVTREAQVSHTSPERPLAPGTSPVLLGPVCNPLALPAGPAPCSHCCCFSDRSAAASPEDPLSSPGVCQQLCLLPLQQHLSSPSPRMKQDGPLR